MLVGIGDAYSIAQVMSARLEYEDFGKIGTARGSKVRVNG